MIWALIAAGAVLAAAATTVVGALVFQSKLLAGLLGTGSAVLVAFLATAVLTSTGQAYVGTNFSHEQLDADRVMTEQMATAVGPGMEAQMTTYGMLERSANEAYLRALEQHTYQVDRMLGRVP